jgi:hypothetical protein
MTRWEKWPEQALGCSRPAHSLFGVASRAVGAWRRSPFSHCGTKARRFCCGFMDILFALIRYVGGVGLVSLALVFSGAWLLRSDPSAMTAQARTPLVPQKILDSIERKKPIPVDVGAPSQVRAAVPAFQSAPVALIQPAARESIRALPGPKKKSHKIRREQESATAQQLETHTPLPPAHIATSRSDFPY